MQIMTVLSDLTFQNRFDLEIRTVKTDPNSEELVPSHSIEPTIDIVHPALLWLRPGR